MNAARSIFTSLCAGLMITTSMHAAPNDLSQQIVAVAQKRLAKSADDKLGKDLLAFTLSLDATASAVALKQALANGQPIAAPLTTPPTNVAIAARLSEMGEKLISRKNNRTTGLLYLSAAKRIDPLQEKSHMLLLKAKQHKLETDFHKLIVAVAGKNPLADELGLKATTNPEKKNNLELALIKIPSGTFYYRSDSTAERVTAIKNAGKTYKYQIAVDPAADLPIREIPGGKFEDSQPLPKKDNPHHSSLNGSLEAIIHRFCSQTRTNYQIDGRVITFTAIDNPQAVEDHGFILGPIQLKEEFAGNQSKATMRFRGKSVLMSGKVTGFKQLAGGKSAITLENSVEVHLSRAKAAEAEKIRRYLMDVQKRQNPKNYDMDDYWSKASWKKAMKQNIEVSLRAKCWGSKFGTVILVEPDPFDWRYNRSH